MRLMSDRTHCPTSPSPGVHLMRDTRTNVYNFDERIRILPHPDEIDLKRFPAYVTASKDQVLSLAAGLSSLQPLSGDS